MSANYKFRNSIGLTVFQMIFYAVILIVFLRWAFHFA